MAINPFPALTSALDNVLNLVEKEEEDLTEQCRLVNTLFEPVEEVARPKSATPPKSFHQPVGKAGYEKQKLSVSIRKRSYEYKNIDDLLDRVVSEDELKKSENFLTPIQQVVREGAPLDMIDGQQLADSYIKLRLQQKDDPVSANLEKKMDLLAKEESERYLQLDSNNVVPNLLKLIELHKNNATPSLPNRPPKEVCDSKTVEADIQSRREMLQSLLNEALLEDLDSIEVADSEVPSMYRAVNALMDVSKMDMVVLAKEQFK